MLIITTFNIKKVGDYFMKFFGDKSATFLKEMFSYNVNNFFVAIPVLQKRVVCQICKHL